MILSALADPGRRAILKAMYQAGGPIDCATLVEKAGLSNPAFSHHCRVLREAGLTRTVAEGRRRVVRVRLGDVEGRFPGLLGAVLGAAERGSSAG
nr:helix-turn-helix domain-containing protein [Amycolatopsis circi]